MDAKTGANAFVHTNQGVLNEEQLAELLKRMLVGIIILPMLTLSQPSERCNRAE